MIQSSKTRSESSIFSSADKEIRPPVGIELRVSWQVECHGKGFTLVELLVVMAVLAILSAMTLSALATARGTAETARCNSNARQLGLAARMYWDDFNNESFPYRSDSNAEGIRYWFGRLGSGSEGQRILHREFGPLYSYLRNSAVWLVPAPTP